mmetsp:Transcript_23598/g.43806  ORF Transcript_23598/g.43806 Transcript_23598/m.43806 type:complete len:109 (+) Transcript_23598:301-627(+)
MYILGDFGVLEGRWIESGIDHLENCSVRRVPLFNKLGMRSHSELGENMAATSLEGLCVLESSCQSETKVDAPRQQRPNQCFAGTTVLVNLLYFIQFSRDRAGSLTCLS